MNLINAFKKWLLNILVPQIEGMPYVESIHKKKNDLSKEKRFRDLLKKRNSFLIIGAFTICSMLFGIGKSFTFFTWLIALSPFVVIFWSLFGEKIMDITKFRENK